MNESIIETKNLYVYYNDVPIVRNVSLKLKRGKILGIVGESGCGKTTLLRALMALGTKGERYEGSVLFNGREIIGMDENSLRELRGRDMSMVPQNATAAMDPTGTISSLFYETLRSHGFKGSRGESDRRAAAIMKSLMLENTQRLLKSYPFELSGGMCQRIAIAAAMVNSPSLILGDEPASALDTVNQAEVVKELKRLRDENGVSIILISHSVGVVAAAADEIAVMYGGRIVETASKDELISSPLHPYTKALIDAVPDMKGNISKGLDGEPPSFTKELLGCPFYDRCAERKDECRKFEFDLKKATDGHYVGCMLFSESGDI